MLPESLSSISGTHLKLKGESKSQQNSSQTSKEQYASSYGKSKQTNKQTNRIGRTSGGITIPDIPDVKLTTELQ